jgi:hypothetical protein
MWLLTVPSGMSSLREISWWVRSSKKAQLHDLSCVGLESLDLLRDQQRLAQIDFFGHEVVGRVTRCSCSCRARMRVRAFVRVGDSPLGDRDQPGREGVPGRIERGTRGPGRHEGLLRHVLGIGSVAQRAQREREHDRRPAADRRARERARRRR